MDYSPPGSSVHGILQARILEWVPIPFSGYLPDPGMEPGSPALQADFLPSEPPGKPGLEMLALLLMGVGRSAVEKAVMTEDQWGWILEWREGNPRWGKSSNLDDEDMESTWWKLGNEEDKLVSERACLYGIPA